MHMAAPPSCPGMAMCISFKAAPEDHENIWEGKPRTTVAGAIFAKEVNVHTFWDLGWNDKMAILCVQKQWAECRVINYLEGSFLRTDEWGAILNKLNYNWGWDHLPPDGYATERKTGKTDAKILSEMGREERDREVIIRATRNLFPKLVLNRGDVSEQYGGMARLLECLKRWKSHVPQSTKRARRALTR
jgi:phage terminase large subunit